MRRATLQFLRIPARFKFQSTLSVRRATTAIYIEYFFGKISIHALREESDDSEGGRSDWHIISIHALREESDSKTAMYKI